MGRRSGGICLKQSTQRSRRECAARGGGRFTKPASSLLGLEENILGFNYLGLSCPFRQVMASSPLQAAALPPSPKNGPCAMTSCIVVKYNLFFGTEETLTKDPPTSITRQKTGHRCVTISLFFVFHVFVLRRPWQKERREEEEGEANSLFAAKGLFHTEIFSSQPQPHHCLPESLFLAARLLL